MTRQYNLLLHPAFIISLFLLLLNDISLKYHFANAFTGKLSDFSGLLVFALFWMVFFPSNKKSIALITAVLFTWWKSPLSTSFIEWCNGLSLLTITRVVDYSDLLALLVLPLAVIIAERSVDPLTKYRKLFIPLIGCISIFSFCFTSAYRYNYQYYAENEIAYDHSVKTRQSEQQILDKLHQLHISYTIDSIAYYPARQHSSNDSYVLRVATPGPDSVKWIPLTDRADSSLYVRRYEGTYYLIPTYRIDDIELENLKIFISKKVGDKNTRVIIERFRWTRPYGDYTAKVRNKLNKHFDRLFDK
jgi:hypothetical protein